MTSVFAGAAVVLSAVAPIAGVSAAYTSVDAANKLATLWVIVDQSANPADYLLGNEITRREMSKVTMKLSSVDVMDVCNWLYSDLQPWDWGCKYAEAGQNAGFFAANPKFRPDANISKWEVLKNIMKARWIEKGNDADFRKGYVDGALAAWIITESFTDYNTPAIRGWIFQVAAEAVDDSWDDDGLGGLFGDLLGDLDWDDNSSNDNSSNGWSNSAATWDSLVVSLSPVTPSSATIPWGISGLPVAKFDFTAGSTDVTINTLTLKRRGLSNKNTLTALAAFTDDGRASKAKDDTQENNTEAQLTLTNPGVVVKAGETKTITIVADVASQSIANGAEFAIELVDVVANGNVDWVSNLVANTMRVGWVDAATVTVKADGSVSDVKVWDDGVEIFKFKVEWANDEDVVLKSITFKGEGSVNENTELMNYALELDGTVVATSEYSNGKYVTFDLGDGVTISEGQTERFKVLADVVAWVNSTIAFKVDKKLDVTAIGSKFGFGADVVITAVDQADGLTSGTNELWVLSIDAGELSLSDIDAPSSKIRADKDNVILGSIEVNNVSGASLELQALSVDASLSAGSFIDDGVGWGTANNGVQDGTEANSTLATVFENFEAEINGTSYELTVANGTLTTSSYSDTDLTIVLPEGVTTMVIRADTKKHVSANTKVNLSVNNIGTTWFKAVEMEEENVVSDITPSSLTFKEVEFISAGAKLSAVPLANSTVVRGSKNIVANQFNVKAEEASLVEVDEVKATITGYTTSAAQVDTITFAGTESDGADEVLTTTITDAWGTSTFTTTVTASTAATAASTVVSAVTSNVTGTSAQTYTVTEAAWVVTVTAGTAGIPFELSTVNTTPGATTDITSTTANTTIASTAVAAGDAKKVIASVALYKWSVSDSNLLKSKWGTNIDSTGTVTFDSFKTTVDANTTDTFIVVLTLVDGVDAVGKVLNVSSITVTANDDDGDDVVVTWTASSSKNVTVTNAGNLVLAYDANNTANKNIKTVLGWTSEVVASYDVQSQNESTDVETVKVTFADASGNMNKSLYSAKLLLNGKEVGSANNEDYNSTTKVLTFDNLTDLIIPKSNVELEVEITTSSIGFEKVGKSIAGETVTKIELADITWVSSGKAVASKSSSATSKAFSIVDVKVTPTLVKSLSNGTAQIKLTADAGDNTQATSESTPVVTLNSLTFTDNGNGAATENVYKIWEDGEAIPTTFAAINTAGTWSSVTSISFTDDVIINILPSGVADKTYSLSLKKNGVAYNTSLTTNMTSELDLGSKTY